MANLPNIAFLGTIFLHGWNGRLANLQSQGDDYARIGQRGSGAQTVGTRARKCAISAWAGTSTKVEAIVMADALEAMQRTVIRVGDDMGRTFERVRVVAITASFKAGYGPTLPTGAQMLYRIDVQATLEVLP